MIKIFPNSTLLSLVFCLLLLGSACDRNNNRRGSSAPKGSVQMIHYDYDNNDTTEVTVFSVSFSRIDSLQNQFELRFSENTLVGFESIVIRLNRLEAGTYTIPNSAYFKYEEVVVTENETLEPNEGTITLKEVDSDFRGTFEVYFEENLLLTTRRRYELIGTFTVDL